MPSEQDVLNSMRHIIDPDLSRDIVSLGFIKDLAIEGGHVGFTLELTTPACPLKAKFLEACESAVKALPGVETVTVKLSARQPQRQVQTPESDALAQVDAIIAVSSCKGGVGKSTVAAHLARTMQRQGLATGLLDADVYGPSMPTLFNMHNPVLYGRDNMILPAESGGLKLMSLGFVLGESPAVLRGPLVSSYIQQILRQTAWGKLDYLIIDMPPGTGDIQLTIVQSISLDGAIIVTTPQALSLVDVAKGILMFERVHVPVLGVVENMSVFTCPDCGAMHHPFGQSRSTLQERFGLPTLAELPIADDIADTARAVPAIEAMAVNVRRAVGRSRAEKPATPEVTLTDVAIHVRWPDGYQAALPMHAVRCACPCALCVDEHSGERTLKSEDVPADVKVENVQHLGNYAVTFAWSDGHTTGIYSWEYLRSLGERHA